MEHAVFGNLIEEAKWLSSQFGDVSFSHVRRQGNCAAHISARHVSEYTVWMEDVPPHPFAVIQADLASFEYSYNVLSQKKKNFLTNPPSYSYFPKKLADILKHLSNILLVYAHALPFSKIKGIWEDIFAFIYMVYIVIFYAIFFFYVDFDFFFL